MTMKKDTKIEEELTSRFKIDMRNFRNFDLSTLKFKNVCCNWLFVTMVCNVWAAKVKSSYFSWHWIAMQNFTKKRLVVWKITWEIWQIFTRALESVKIGTLVDPFVQSTKVMTFNFTENLYVMTMKDNAKFEEKLTCHFNTVMSNLTNFNLSTQKCKKCAL